jgi:hypothetical protein
VLVEWGARERASAAENPTFKKTRFGAKAAVMAERSSTKSTSGIETQLSSSAMDSREISISDPASRRFTVRILQRASKVYFPTIIIGIAVVIIASVMLGVSIFGK